MTRGRDPFDPLDGPIDETLDLHGTTALEAERMVRGFVEGASRRRPGALLHIITGKGRGSAGRPVLKPLVKRLLAGDLTRYVAHSGRDLDEGGYLVRLRAGPGR